MTVRVNAIAMLFAATAAAVGAQPIGSSFTYQGRLTDAGNPANGAYDLQLALFDAASGGAQVGATLTRDDVTVASGLFTVSLDFGTVFAGAKRWLEVRVRPGASTGAYTTLGGRQELTPSPNAAFASSTTWSGIASKPAGFADDIDNDSGGDITAVTAGGGLSGGGTTGAVTVSVDTAVTQARVTGTCGPGSSIQTIGVNGSVTCQADTTGADWRLGGNTGTNPAQDFIGTTDAQPVNLRVGNQRGFRIEPAGAMATYVGPNVVGGHAVNSVSNGAQGAAIAGGGAQDVNGSIPNRVTDHLGAIGGGLNNLAGDGNADPDSATFTTIAGGYTNNAAAQGAAIGGGEFNSATANQSTVAGGNNNVASARYSSVGGGEFNVAPGLAATVPGGESNTAGGDYSLAAGRSARVRQPSETGDANGDEGTFAWADAGGANFMSTGPNQFLVRAGGGVGINTNAPQGDLQLGSATDTTAFRFGSAGARHHLISNRDMVFNAFDADLAPNGQSVFIWRKNFSRFNENSFATLMTLADNADLLVVGNLTGLGNASFAGTLSKGAGAFKIDHPLDPENKYLYHSFVESPDMKNIYDGVVTTDGDGYATVELPEWFEPLNRDFRYQLTVLDEADEAGFVQAKVVRKVKDRRFAIRTSRPRTEVSWQVTGIRHDAFAEKNRIPVEQDKPADERGTYLHPAAFGLPSSRGTAAPR